MVQEDRRERAAERAPRQRRTEGNPERRPSAVSMAILREISADWDPGRSPPARTGL